MLQCGVEGRPPPDITWHRQGREGEVARGDTLTLIASTDTEGGYYCTASSPPLPPASSSAASLSLARPPSLMSPGLQYSSLPDLQLECSSESQGRPTVAWSRAGTDLAPGDHVK